MYKQKARQYLSGFFYFFTFEVLKSLYKILILIVKAQ